MVGHATEYSLSVILGNGSINHELTHWNTYCAHFEHHCAFPGSPCKGPHRRPHQLCPLANYDDDELEPDFGGDMDPLENPVEPEGGAQWLRWRVRRLWERGK